MAQSTLRELAREALRTGKLPNRRPDWLWGGPAYGVACCICGKPVGPGDTAFEAEFVDPLLTEAERKAHSFHVRCFAVWEQERDSLNGTREGLLSGNRSGGTILRREFDSHPRHKEEPA